MNMTQATHAFVATTCNTCHGTATVAFTMGAANPKLQLRPADHTSGTMLTGDCGGFHPPPPRYNGAPPADPTPHPPHPAPRPLSPAAPPELTTSAPPSPFPTP